MEECVAFLFACFDHGWVDLVARHEKTREVEHVDAWVRVGGTDLHSRKLLLLLIQKELMRYVQCPSAIPQGNTQHQLKTHFAGALTPFESQTPSSVFPRRRLRSWHVGTPTPLRWAGTARGRE